MPPLVSIHIITFNHENFIKQCLENILSQRTTFEIEIVIGDDASTDNTQQILLYYNNLYPDKIKTYFASANIGISLNYANVLRKCQGKYIALCEGDDYWSDPYKLQKQIDFLEANPDFGAVHTDYNYIDNNGNPVKLSKDADIPSGEIFEELSKRFFTRTLTLCYRSEFKSKILDFIDNYAIGWLAIDYPIALLIAKESKIYYLPEITAMYRINSASISNNKEVNKGIEWFEFLETMYSYIVKQYNLSPIIRDNHFSYCHIQLFNLYFSSKDIFKLRNCLNKIFQNSQIPVKRKIKFLYLYLLARFKIS